jgi:hypothetical protein
MNAVILRLLSGIEGRVAVAIQRDAAVKTPNEAALQPSTRSNARF